MARSREVYRNECLSGGVNESTTQLFVAGVSPGLVLALNFMAYVAIHSKL